MDAYLQEGDGSDNKHFFSGAAAVPSKELTSPRGERKRFDGFRFSRHTLKRLLFLDIIYPDIFSGRQQVDSGGKATAREIFLALQCRLDPSLSEPCRQLQKDCTAPPKMSLPPCYRITYPGPWPLVLAGPLMLLWSAERRMLFQNEDGGSRFAPNQQPDAEPARLTCREKCMLLEDAEI